MRSTKQDGLANFCDLSASTNELAPGRKSQVVIVGAGLAGLAAAQRLYSAGIKNFILLEAQDRIGGRVQTVGYSNYLLELGAQWLHGADMNPLYRWMVDLDLLDDFEDASLGFRGLYCSDRGSHVDQKFVRRVLEILNESKLTLFSNCYAQMELKNAAQVFRHQLELHMRDDLELQQNNGLVWAIFDWFLRYESIENSCDSMDEVSISSYTDWTNSGDGSLLNFKNGYSSLVDWFCSQFPTNRLLHLNKQVTSIEQLRQLAGSASTYVDESGRHYSRPMLIRYLDRRTGESSKLLDLTSSSMAGSQLGQCKAIECDHVIVTTSLGFLKENQEKLFRPPLPEVKRELINSLGFGTVNKIILEFESPFWDENSSGLKMLWEGASKSQATGTKQPEDGNDFPTWSKDIIAFDSVRRQPNLLIGWIGNKGAKLMERETDSEIARTCLRILQRFLPAGHAPPSRLVGCICSRWNSNQFIRGSYSFQSMQSFDKNIEKLHEPIYSNEDACDAVSGAAAIANSNHNLSGELGAANVLGAIGSNGSTRMPRIMFAGEATAGKLYSTAHGAVLSGWREADRLLSSNLLARQPQAASSNELAGIVPRGPLTASAGLLANVQ